MLSLYMLGSFLEPIVGRLRFLVFYMISGLAGSVGVLWLGDGVVPPGCLSGGPHVRPVSR